MKKGDIVTIKDGSYTRSVINGKLIHEWLAHGTETRKRYMVVETGCRFPLVEYHQPEPYHNNTVIQVLYENSQTLARGKVVFIHERFLRLVTIREVTMAEVCAQFGEDVKIKKN